MYSHYISVAVPVALILITCATPTAASPTLIVKDKHHLPMHNKTSPHTTSNPDKPRRARVKHVIARSQPVRRAAPNDQYLDALTLQHSNILSAANVFFSAAQNTRSNSNDDSRQATAASLTDFQQSLVQVYPLLTKLGADHGLAFYDKTDQYETLLKDIVNANKNIFRDTYDLIAHDPLLGPLLGPIAYNIKCILDELLDLTENVTDAILNSIALLLQPVIQSATVTACQGPIPPVAGLCL